jgi:hypothetical protein
MMYAKVFSQILDSSIANDYQLRHFFTDMLILAEIDGVVDMTHEAIAARTRMPLEIVQKFIVELEQPDAKSRSHKEDGRRIVRIDPLRDWGWQIVNYIEYRRIASEEQRREKTKTRVRKFRNTNDVTHGNAPVTHGNACNAMQRQRQRQRQRDKEMQKEKELPPIPVADKPPERKSFMIPAIEEMQFHGEKIGLPPIQVEQARAYWESNGWKVGKNPMKSWKAAMQTWKLNFESRKYLTQNYGKPTAPVADHSKGFFQ